MDTGVFNNVLSQNVYDYLLAGRSVCRVRYVPKFIDVQMGGAGTDSEEPQHEQLESDSESYEELDWEQVVLEHTQYDDFRHGPGRAWAEVCWVAFRHALTKDEIEERFGEDKAAGMAFSEADEGDDDATTANNTGKLKTGTAEVWEIWDKDSKTVIFVSNDYGNGVLSKVDDPLQLQDFYPCPAPIYAVPNPTTLKPTPLYKEYSEQADELDRISRRINKITDALKVRGIYDSTIAELSQLMTGDDNQLFPVENYALIADKGGLDKAIWMQDITKIADVLQQLYVQREQCKAVIYEIMGLSDILRGASNANETATAQGIKAQWGGQRVGRMQRDFQYYIRDIVRMMSEIIGQKFQIETLKGMTGLQFADEAQAQQMAAQYQQQAAMAQQQGQQPPPPPKMPVTWEQIKAAMADDMSRSFKIDIETDSTLAASMQTDMAALRDLLAGLAQMMGSFAPFVQAGAMPVETVKELSLAIIRRAKLGNAVEDAFDKISQPKQPTQTPDNSLQIEQMKQQLEMEKIKADMQIEREKMAANLQIKQLELAAETEREKMRLHQQFLIEQHRFDNQLIAA